MKNLIPVVIIGILILSGLGASALHKTDDAEQKTMAVVFSQPVIQEKNQYAMVEIDGADSVLMRANEPMLPAYVHTFTFPFGTKIEGVECIPSSVQQQHVSKKIMPSPEPVLAGQQIMQEKKSVPYGDVPYPNTWYEYDVGCGLNNNERCVFVKVQVFPVQYHPSEDLLKVARDFQINVEYEEPTQQTMTFDDECDFIILAPSEFSSTLNTLVTHKIARGISTKLVTLDEIYDGSYFPVNGRDNQEKIKYFIKNAIENWDTKDVLLVGSSEEFPTRQTHVFVDYDSSNPDYEVFVSDLYYADIYNETYEFCSWDSNENDLFGEYDWDGSYDDVDFYPDVHLGRLACVDSNEVTACVNKIITYETNKAYTRDWFTNLVVIGGDSFPGDDDAILEGEYVNEQVISIMDGFIPERLWVSNDVLSRVSPSGVTSINNVINDGCGFIDFSGHGNTNVWATHIHENENVWAPTPFGQYLNSNIADLENGNELPIIITGACSVGKFNKDDDCFSWSFVSNPNGGGIASCGATALGYAYLGQWVTYGLVEKMATNMFRAYKDGTITFGEMWVKAINDYMSAGMDAGDYKTIEEWQPFGDPTLSIGGESMAPEKPDVPEGPASGKINEEHTYTAFTTDPDEDQIYYLFDWGNGEFSGYIGPYDSGKTAEAKHEWEEKGNYAIRVIAKDEHGAIGEWSDPLSVSMPKRKVTNNPFQNFLENHPHMFLLLGRQLAKQCTMETESLSTGSSRSKSNCGYLPPVMRLDLEMVKRLRDDYRNAQKVFINPELEQKIQTTSSYSILDLLDYVPSERDQHWCGNCWAWPATGVLGIALFVQEGIFDRLSVQYINSCGSNIGVGCCEGGNLHIFSRFYRYTDMAIPWSNENAQWKDKFAQCNTPCESISIEPNYPIYDISEETIETHEIPEEEAIDNIKNVLHQQKGVYFSWFLPNMDYRKDFSDFWNKKNEDDIYSLDWACGEEFDEEEGGGHAVLCVGYNDEEGTDNDYWVMLNSWGTTSRRPNGLFCVDMHMDYDCTILFDGHEYNSFDFQTLFVDFLSDDEAPNIPVIDGSESGKVNSLCFYNISAVDPQGDDVYFSIDWGDGTTEEWLGAIASGVEMKVNHSWGKRGNYIIKVKAKDIHDMESDWATLEVSMSKNKILINTPFIDFLKNHPHMFPLLQQIFGL